MNINRIQGLALGISMIAVAAFALPAKSADLGGNCCADLEERIAELEATTARKGNNRVKVTVSGHVSQSIMYFDSSEEDLNDAVGDNPQIRGHDYSASRFRVTGDAKINNDWSAGYLIEIGVPNSGDMTVRHNVLWIKSKGLGRFMLGTTSQASDGALETNLGALGSGFALGSLGNAGGAIADANLAPSPFNLNLDVSPLFGFDGSRKELIKYVSPSVAGFSLSASWSDDDHYDVALRYAGEFGQIRVAGAAFHRDEDTRRVSGGSASIMDKVSGVYAVGAYAKSTGDQSVDVTLGLAGINATFSPVLCDCDTELMGGIVGISKKMGSLGATNIGIFYEKTKLDDFSASWDRYGVMLEQNIDAAAMTMFLIYEHHEIDLGAIGEGDADVIIGGAKIRF